MQSRAGKITLWLIVILITPIVLYWLFANTVIKSVLESQLSEAHGAEVNITDVSHSLFPVTVDIDTIQFTDARDPLRNQLVVGNMRGDVDVMALLNDQLIMNQLSILDVAFNQPRQSRGEVLRQPTGKSFDTLLSEAKEALPEVDELLERSPLKTTAAVQNAQQTYAVYADELQNDYQQLPDKARLDYYKKQVKQLLETDYKSPAELAKAKEAFDALKQEIRADKALVTNFKEKASTARKALSASLQELKTAPQQDYALLQGIYAGDHAALSQLTEAVFGDKAAQYNSYLFTAFDLIVPLLKGGDDNTETATDAGSPLQVLIRKANVSVNWQDTLLTGDWENITNVHSIFGNPTTFLLNSVADGKQSFTTKGQFFLDENGLDASQTWQIAGLLLESIRLSDNAKLDASIKQALLATAGSLTITDNALDGSGSIDLTKLAMAATGSNKITRAVADLLGSLSSLDIQMDISGSLNAPDFGFSSDLDNQLAGAALATLSASQQDKLDELNRKLQSMVGEQNDMLSSELGDINTWIKASQNDEAALQELLQASLKNVVDKQKDKLLNKLFDKLNGR
ncbi:TIGR03545 family protein [Alteromonas gilva]|uniref:TIGR03545 family protein n=1 Tax=Alteromonas gilva TaxID=2987522 RepID=A0ABT5L7R8_9ALTE|nr:TIGR03545 family protein [Alteromonas gilva]MDC8833095.1 TIGR03545 family protein [Alteromonas gilva]